MRDERDLVEVDLLAQDQVQEQVEGTLEDRGLHVVGHGTTLAAKLHACDLPRLPGRRSPRYRLRDDRPRPPTPRRRTARIAALVVACALVAFGCSGGSSADPPRSTPPTTAPGTTVGRRRSAGCGRPADAARVGKGLPGDVPLRFPVGGHDRSYRLGVPRSYDPNRPTPLIVNLHGAGSNVVQASVYSDLPRQAGARGYLVVTPDAIDGKWQLSPAGTDADFLAALVDDVERRYCVDLDRVHLIGMSLGAWKAAATACHDPDRYASIALVTVEVYPGKCPPMPVVAFHGTADPVVAYGAGGGTVESADTPNAGLPGTLTNIAAWAEGNGCAPEPSMRDSAPT